MNLVIQLSLERVWALRDAPVQVIRLIDGQVVRADGRHGQTTNPTDSTGELDALTVVLNLRMPRFSHYIIVSRRNATIAS